MRDVDDDRLQKHLASPACKRGHKRSGDSHSHYNPSGDLERPLFKQHPPKYPQHRDHPHPNSRAYQKDPPPAGVPRMIGQAQPHEPRQPRPYQNYLNNRDANANKIQAVLRGSRTRKHLNNRRHQNHPTHAAGAARRHQADWWG